MATFNKAQTIGFHSIPIVSYPQNLFCQHPPIHVRTTNPLVDFFLDSFSFFLVSESILALRHSNKAFIGNKTELVEHGVSTFLSKSK